MTDALPAAIEAEVLAILDTLPDDREAAVLDLCRRHPAWSATIRARLHRMAAIEADLTQAIDRGDLPTSIGPFAIERRLGEGGMGTVYLGHQTEPVERRVAVKVVQRGRDTAAVLRRFELERRTLAALDHLHIARLLEAGMADGRPYFAMEWVDGEPITAYCARHELAIRRRVELFLGVCRGVQHAHQKGVIHRDLKPSNVLVATVDGQPVPKIIDFGLARALTDEDEPDLALTQAGAIIGTPAYMSPEQIRGERDRIDIRTDVWSLGVLLFELLTDLLPFAADDGSSMALAEIQQRILDAEPRRPSALAGRRLPTDLDWIVLRALEKVQKQRYQTVAALAADVDAHLRDLPIAASPPSAGDRIIRLVRRNRAASIAAAVILLTLLASTIIGWSLFLHGEQQRTRAEDGLRRFQRLALVVRLEEADAAARELGPSWPVHIDARQAWLAEHGEPLERALAAVRAELAAPSPAAASPASPTAGDGRDAEAERFLRRRLRELEIDLAAFVEAPDGALQRVRHDLEWSTTIARRSCDEHADLWAATCRDIATDHRYGGLSIAPQLGLVPLGRDPDSDLFEFYHLRSGAAAGELPRRDAGGRLELGERSGIVFVLLPAGRFWMGAQSDDQTGQNYDPGASEFERPVHEVALDAFFLGKHEVSQAQWHRLTFGGAPSMYLAGQLNFGVRLTARHPVEQVSWFEATRTMGSCGLTLPTEAQWEYAARAGHPTPYSCGARKDDLRGHANIADLALQRALPRSPVETFLDDGHAAHSPVGHYAANDHGLHDVHGNVWEWTLDSYEEYDAPVTGAGGRRGTESAKNCLVRGGDFARVAAFARTAFRMAFPPNARHNNLGLRAARALVR